MLRWILLVACLFLLPGSAVRAEEPEIPPRIPNYAEYELQLRQCQESFERFERYRKEQDSQSEATYRGTSPGKLASSFLFKLVRRLARIGGRLVLLLLLALLICIVQALIRSTWALIRGTWAPESFPFK